MSRVTAFALAFAASLLAACPRPPPRSAADLVGPTYSWSLETGTCGEVHALDGHGVLWTEKGCESNSTGLRYVRAVAPEERQRILAAFKALVSPKPSVCPDDLPENRFEAREGDRAHIYRLCIAKGDHVPEPFAAVVRAFGGEP